MSLQFTPTTATSELESVTAQPEEVEVFDITLKKQEMTEVLVRDPAVEQLVSSLNVNDQQTLVKFGDKAADEIAKVSDQVLNSMNMHQINDTGKLLTALATIMDKFDLDEIGEEKKGLAKFFNKMQKKLDEILAKYHTMGEEVDKVYIQLREYETEIGESNRKLDSIFQSNVNFYNDLLKYIIAGEQGVRELDSLIEQKRAEYDGAPSSLLQLDLNNLEQARIVLDQRVADLRIAENVAMQSIPMIQTMRFANLNLVRKINSAFIITLPVFKQALTQAILLKRQRIQAQAMQALDERTNEMLLKNAQNTVDQAKLTTQLASTSAVKVETLEQTWRTIVNGIEETRRIQEDATAKRQDDAKRLQALKEDYQKRVHL